MAKIKLKIKKQILYKGDYFQFVKEGHWEYTERRNCTGNVIILALTNDKKVVFVEQYRIPLKKNVIEFPAGLVNDQKLSKRESLLTAAHRELLEETGYKATKMKEIVSGPVSSGSAADLVSMIRAYGLRKIHKGGGDITESITVHEVPLKTVEAWLKGMRKKGRLVDPRIYAGLYFLIQNSS